ncbi:putative elongator complex protein 2 [Aphelenchoides fujianensis]|nr:putative elongator complex protein 2 [Aphelenchoides fujianensis]
MDQTARFQLLSAGGAPRNHTANWLNEELVVYGGFAEICIARNKDGELVPEAVLPVLEKSTFRTVRSVRPLKPPADGAAVEKIEVVCTAANGQLLVVAFKRGNERVKWRSEVVYQDCVEPGKMVDAFAFRNAKGRLVLCHATFESVEVRFFREDDQTFVTLRAGPLEGHRLINCLHFLPLEGEKSAFVCVFGRTDKKLAVHLLEAEDPELEQTEAKKFEPLLLELKEAVFDLDIRADRGKEAKGHALEILAGMVDRVQVWKIYPAPEGAGDTPTATTGFSLETEIPLEFAGFGRLLANLNSNILITSSDERLSSVRWDNERANFVIATRENSIRVYSLDSSGIWTQKARSPLPSFFQKSSLQREACAYGEPALELCGIFDAALSPSSRWLLAHNTIGGFYFFECDDEFNFTPISVFIGGHGGKVRGLAWHDGGDVLLSVGADKTTRYFQQFPKGVWGQRSRPQVHGHEIRCITSLNKSGFVSGAAEHMFRVFDNHVPKLSVKEAIERIQPLNLTPKAAEEDAEVGPGGDQPTDAERKAADAAEDASRPANEELLQSGAKVHTEVRKLYAHGNECYAVACTSSGRLVFTAAKGSRPEEAQLIVWAAGDQWKILQRVPLHTFTVTAMSVSSDGRFLLSVSRDRSVNVLRIDEYDVLAPLKLHASLEAAHRRVIWTCAWIPGTHMFATGSRDGFVALFELINGDAALIELQRVKVGECVSALDFGYRLSDPRSLVLVMGTESGDIHVANIVNKQIAVGGGAVKLEKSDGFGCSGLIYALRQLQSRSEAVRRVFGKRSHQNVLGLKPPFKFLLFPLFPLSPLFAG